MSRRKNLKSFNNLPVEEARAIQSAGGKASAEAKRKRKELREELEILMDTKAPNGKTYQENISFALLKEAVKGNTKAYEIIRDTLGQKPIERQEVREITTEWFK